MATPKTGLTACISPLNCVFVQKEFNDADKVFNQLKKIAGNIPRTTILEDSNNYWKGICRSLIFRFPDVLEILKIGWFFSKDFQSHYEFIENTPEEITAVALEMDDRLKGEWEENEEDEELQSRFWALFGPEKLKSPELRMGAEFLRQNQDLLEA